MDFAAKLNLHFICIFMGIFIFKISPAQYGMKIKMLKFCSYYNTTNVK